MGYLFGIAYRLCRCYCSALHKAGFTAICCVLVNDPTLCSAIHDGNRKAHRGGDCFCITRYNCGLGLLDCGLDAALRSVVTQAARTGTENVFYYRFYVYSFRKVSTFLYTISHYSWHGRLNHCGVKPTGSGQRNDNLALERHALFNARHRWVIQIH